MAREKINTTWNYIQNTSIILGIVSSIFSALIFFGVGDIKTILSNQTELLDITLNESSINKISGKSISINGSVLLRESKKSAVFYLKERNLDIYPLARRTVPLGNWRVYPRPIIRDDGELYFTIDLSYLSSKDSSNTIQVILISCGRDLLSDGFEFNNLLPYFSVSSNPISIRYY
jgi:hypothetical protein